MHRLGVLQNLFDATCAHRRSGQPKIHLTPVYYSIFLDFTVQKNNDINLALCGNPEYIICFVLVPQDGVNGYHKIEELFGFINQKGSSDDKISLSKWNLQKILMHSNGIVQSFELRKNDDPKECFKYTIIGSDTIHKRLNIEHLWRVFNEIDSNCETSREALIYLDYFFATQNLNNSKLTLRDYEINLSVKENLITQYKDLLTRFQEIVDGNHKISKT